MQSRLIVDNEKKHFVLVDFINTIHYENFIVNFENELRTFLREEKMSDLITSIFFKKRRINLHHLIDA
jgi:hypothetical protein